MNDDLQEDIDQAAEHEQQLLEKRRREEPNSGVMDPRCFTTPMNWPIYNKQLKKWV